MTKYLPYDERFPDGKGDPAGLHIRDDQEWKIQRALNEPTQGVLIADDMGKGKTLMATEIILRSKWSRVLITGVRDTGKQWRNSFNDQSDGEVQLKIMNSLVSGEKNYADFMEGKPGIYFSGIQWLTSRDWETIKELDHFGRTKPVYDKKSGELVLTERRKGAIGPAAAPKFHTVANHLKTFRKLDTKKRHVDALIFDEVHKMQNRHSNTARTVVSIKTDWRIGLSGTFMGNNFQGSWKVCRWIWPMLIDASFVRWKRNWCELFTPVHSNGFAIESPNPHGDTSKVVGEINEGAFVKSLPCYIRDEPEPVPPARVIKVKLTDPQWKQYDQIKRLSLTWLDAHTPAGREPLISDLPITQRQRMRTATLGEMSFTEEMKVSFADDAVSSKLNVVAHVIKHIWVDQPIIIGVYDREFARIAAARLRAAGFGAVYWNGDVTSKKRDHIKEQFIARNPEYRYIVCTIPSIGTGTDGLQLACSKLIWMEESESQVDNLQFAKRSFRPGMTLDFGEFDHVKIVAEGTIDEGIMSRHDAQSESMNASLRLTS
jgi:SNF2 family DNA or RNA helicase